MEVNRWSCLSNYGLVLLAIGEGDETRMRDLAEQVGLTERAVQRIVTELCEAELVTRRREGRRNFYTVCRGRRLRHPLASHRTVGDLVNAFRPRPAERGVA